MMDSLSDMAESFVVFFLAAIPKLLQVGGDGSVQLRGFGLLLARGCAERRHRFLRGPWDAICGYLASSASISSTVGKLPLRLSGSASTIFFSHSDTPIRRLRFVTPAMSCVRFRRGEHSRNCATPRCTIVLFAFRASGACTISSIPT